MEPGVAGGAQKGKVVISSSSLLTQSVVVASAPSSSSCSEGSKYCLISPLLTHAQSAHNGSPSSEQ